MSCDAYGTPYCTQCESGPRMGRLSWMGPQSRRYSGCGPCCGPFFTPQQCGVGCGFGCGRIANPIPRVAAWRVMTY